MEPTAASWDTPGAKGAKTRQAILEAAIERFGREGYRATSVADIARDATVGGTVAYAYFPNKQALFLAAIDEDAAAVIEQGLASVTGERWAPGWRQQLMARLISALEGHPLTRRVLSGMESDVTARVLEIPALSELRKAVAERLRSEQLFGTIRPDIDPVVVGNGLVTLTLSLLMSVVQLGVEVAAAYGDDVVAVLEAALEPRGTEGDAHDR